MDGYTQALSLYQQVLEINEKVYGKEHPHVAINLGNLAKLYRNMCKYAQALLLFQQASKINEKVFGGEHPLVAINLNNLALLYSDMDEHIQTLPLYERALKVLEEKLGHEHPNMQAARENYECTQWMVKKGQEHVKKSC